MRLGIIKRSSELETSLSLKVSLLLVFIFAIPTTGISNSKSSVPLKIEVVFIIDLISTLEL